MVYMNEKGEIMKDFIETDAKSVFLTEFDCLNIKELNKEFIEKTCNIKIKKLLKLRKNEARFGFDIFYE